MVEELVVGARRRESTRRRRLRVIGSLFLVADIGYSFLFGALATILLQRGVALETVGWISLLGVVYVARFLVAPLVDRVGSVRHGHYRSWLLSTQVVLVLAFGALAALDPVADLPVVLIVVAVVLVVSAFHDTAINGMSVRLLPPSERGTGNGVQAAAATGSILLGSGGALLVYAHAGWSATVLAVAAVFTVPLAVLARFVEPPPPQRPVARRGGGRRELITVFRTARTAVWAVAVVPAAVVGIYLTTATQSAMLLAAGWSLDHIVLVQYTLAVAAGMAAGIGTGAAISRWGRRRTVVPIGIGTVAATAAHLPLAAGDGGAMASVAVVLMSAVYCAQVTWIFTVSMDLSRATAAATDFTVQISVMGLLRMVLTGPALVLAGQFGHPWLVALALALTVGGAIVTTLWARAHALP